MEHTENEKAKQSRTNSEGLKRRIVFFGIIIAIIEILGFVLLPIAGQSGALADAASGILVLLLLPALGGYALFVLSFLVTGWKHPRWYVKLYTTICFFLEGFLCLFLFVGFLGGAASWGGEGGGFPFIYIILVIPACGASPLIPIWYWCHKKEKRREEQTVETTNSLGQKT